MLTCRGPSEQSGGHGASNMVVAKTGVATRVNKIESHAHLTNKIMRGTLDKAFKLNKLSNTLWFKNHRKKIKYSLKMEAAFNRLREGTAPGNSGDRTLCSNRWAVRRTMLQNNLDDWVVIQELWGGILEGKVHSGIRGQVLGVQVQIQTFNFLFGIQLSCYKAH